MMLTRYLLIVSLGVFFFAISAAQVSAKDPGVLSNTLLAAIDLSGTYKSNFGKVTIVQDKNSVTGIINHQNGVKGKFKGIVRSGNVVIVWENPTDYGTARLKILNGGKALSGTFTDQNGKTGTWKLNKVN